MRQPTIYTKKQEEGISELISNGRTLKPSSDFPLTLCLGLFLLIVKCNPAQTRNIGYFTLFVVC